MAQSNKYIQETKRIGNSLYLIDNGERFKVDPKTVTVKLKSSEKELGTDFQIIRSNRLWYIDIRVPDGIDVEKYVNNLKRTNKFESRLNICWQQETQ